MTSKRLSPLLFSALLLLSLAACATDGAQDPIDSLQGMRTQREARLATAASEAVAAGRTAEALALYKKRYGTSPAAPDIALNYAQLLRKSDRADESIAVLQKFTGKEGEKEKAPVLLLNEYAAASIETGDFDTAIKVLRRVIDNPDARAFHADAYNLNGIALDATGDHRQAEKMFRAALENWKGDNSSVMNNLALALAGQGMFDESLLTLRRALVAAPDKAELARNIQIITQLRESLVPKAPVKGK